MMWLVGMAPCKNLDVCLAQQRRIKFDAKRVDTIMADSSNLFVPHTQVIPKLHRYPRS